MNPYVTLPLIQQYRACIGQAMSKKNGSKGPAFVSISWKLLNSKAIQAITPMSRAMLPYFLGKPKLFFTDRQYCHKEFKFTYSEAQTLGCARATFYRVIKDLMLNGFIDPVEKGHLSNDKGYPNIFKLSERWQLHGHCDFKSVKWETFINRMT